MAMLRSSALVIAFIGYSALAGCTTQSASTSTAQSRSGGKCFIPSEVNSFTATKDGNVDVKVGSSRYFRLTLGGGCPNNINFATSVGIRATGGGTFICEGYDAELIVPDPSGTQRCPISAVHAISEEQYLADRKT
jgi:Family of unknown function (DUF6491)